MKNRIFLLLAALLLVAALPLTVLAHEIPDSSFDGSSSITVTLNYPGGISMGSLTLHKVGAVHEEDGNYSFVPWGSFADKWDRYEEISSSALAEELAAFAAEGRLKGITQAIGAEGSVTFSGLELGLYLVVQETAAEGYAPIRPFLIGVPNRKDGAYVYQVDASPKVQLETLPTEPAGTQPTKPTEPTLPNTGQLNWPIPLMAVFGLGLFILGWGLRFGKRESADEN